MDGVNKTLYIPLYGKAYVSRKGILLRDPKAEEIWAREGFPLKGKSRSKWLAYYMGMRSAVFDRWLREKTAGREDIIVLHLGCGMDSRVLRLEDAGIPLWYDVDFPAVMEERRKYFAQRDGYHMLAADLREAGWLEGLPRDRKAVVVMEGVSMYLRPEELHRLLARLAGHFEGVELLMDCYTTLAAKLSRYKNPINEVGVTEVYGMDDPALPGMTFIREHDMTPEDMIGQLAGMEKVIFRRLYAGGISRKMYRLYEYKRGEKSAP